MDAIEIEYATALREGEKVRFTVTAPGLNLTFSMPSQAAAEFGQWLKDEAHGR